MLPACVSSSFRNVHLSAKYSIAFHFEVYRHSASAVIIMSLLLAQSVYYNRCKCEHHNVSRALRWFHQYLSPLGQIYSKTNFLSSGPQATFPRIRWRPHTLTAHLGAPAQVRHCRRGPRQAPAEGMTDHICSGVWRRGTGLKLLKIGLSHENFRSGVHCGWANYRTTDYYISYLFIIKSYTEYNRNT